jgi:hypothetical protein
MKKYTSHKVPAAQLNMVLEEKNETRQLTCMDSELANASGLEV